MKKRQNNSQSSYIPKFFLYIIEYFYARLLLVLSACILLIYYTSSILNRNSYVADNHLISLLTNDTTAEYIDATKINANNYESTIVLIGSINNKIKEKEYEKAILLIDNLKNNIDKKYYLNRYLNIRQAIIYIYLANDIKSYEQILNEKFAQLGQETINSLISIFHLYKSNS